MTTQNSLTPINHKTIGSVLRHALEVKLRDHPEAFDCLIFPAMPSEQNEASALIEPVSTMLDRDERRQSYGAPVKARAMFVPDDALAFEMTDSGLYKSFGGASESINLLVSEQGIRTFSLVQWLEYPSLETADPVERTVYVASIQPLGRILGAGVVYICYPLPALGEIPDIEMQEDDKTDTPPPPTEGFVRMGEVGEL